MAHDVENICMNTIPIVPAVTNHTAPGDDDTYEEITPAEIIHANVRDRHNENMNEKNIDSSRTTRCTTREGIYFRFLLNRSLIYD